MPADLHKAREMFLHAVGKLPPDQWESYVREATQGNAELEQQVHQLLNAHLQAGSFLKSPAIGSQTSVIQPNPGAEFADLAGSMIGPYKLLEQIGEGGMGAVWKAQQTEPLNRLVAVKLIKPGMNSKNILARFESERQTLALMDHPNIARVLDAGATDDGRPYFVMELVNGVPITEYCDEHCLTPRQRLELFIPVCQAVQHAHQKGIIHRDLKPSNVLVANYDNRSVPKVIDFGVAKAINVPLSEGVLQTAYGDVVGTVQYMSPEQASLNQLDVDTRSDIYSLGILLYELLAGSPPFSAQELQMAGLLEVLRVIREEEPSRPSTKLSTADGLPRLAANRGTEPRRLTSLVRGELDWIVMKALEKDRNRRYETAERLAVDLRCYLNNQPVEACPPSSFYRMSKAISRNKGLVMAVAAVLLALVSGIIGTTWGLMRVEAARELAEENERQAREATAAEQKSSAAAREREAETKAVLEFVETKVFAAARPEGLAGGLGSQVTLRKALETAIPFVDKSFTSEPLIEARLRLTIGRSFLYLGEPKTAMEQFQKSRALYEKHRGGSHPDTLRSILDVSNSADALGHYADALKLREELLVLQTKALGDDHPDTLKTRNNLVNSYNDFARYDIAAKMGEELLPVTERLLGSDAPETLSCMNNLSITYRALGKYQKALQMREKISSLREKKLGSDHPDTLRSLHNLAISYQDIGNHKEALKLCESVLAKRQAKFGPDHPETLATMNNIATGYRALGRDSEALELREKLVALSENKLGKNHPETWRWQYNLAISYQTSGRHSEALKLREDVYRKRNETFGPDHPDTINAMEGLAQSYHAHRRFDESIKLRRTVLARREAQGLDHPNTLRILRELAATLIQANQGEEAIPLIDACYARGFNKQVESRIIPGVLVLRLKHFEKLGNVAECCKTAEMWEQLNRTDAESLYAIAGIRALTASLYLANDQSQKGQKEANQAMHWLEQAMATGKKTVETVLNEKYFEVLRDRDDFQKLISEAKLAEGK